MIYNNIQDLSYIDALKFSLVFPQTIPLSSDLPPTKAGIINRIID